MDKIKLFICDDEYYWLEIFEEYIQDFEGFELAGKTTEISELKDGLKTAKPDVLLLDIQIGSATAGIDIIPDLTQEFPDVKIIMLTSHDDDEYVFASFANGASDYLTKDMKISQMFSIIRAVHENKASLRPEIANKLTSRAKSVQDDRKSMLVMISKLIKLTNAEYELLKARYNGETYAQIAKKRFVEPEAVRMMGSRVLNKMGSSNMDELVDDLKKLKFFDLMQ